MNELLIVNHLVETKGAKTFGFQILLRIDNNEAMSSRQLHFKWLVIKNWCSSSPLDSGELFHNTYPNGETMLPHDKKA